MVSPGDSLVLWIATFLLSLALWLQVPFIFTNVSSTVLLAIQSSAFVLVMFCFYKLVSSVGDI